MPVGRIWPLVGRAEELRYIDAATQRADGPRGVVLAGAAGVGKTRLAREALTLLTRRGASARWATGTASHERCRWGPSRGG
jgi:predicted ATPase